MKHLDGGADSALNFVSQSPGFEPAKGYRIVFLCFKIGED